MIEWIGSLALFGASAVFFIWTWRNPRQVVWAFGMLRYAFCHPRLFFRYRMWEDEHTYAERRGWH
jgi:hypothetical protein